MKKKVGFQEMPECRSKSQRLLDQFGKRRYGCRRQHVAKSRVPVQAEGNQSGKMRDCTGMREKAMWEGSRADGLVRMP